MKQEDGAHLAVQVPPEDRPGLNTEEGMDQLLRGVAQWAAERAADGKVETPAMVAYLREQAAPLIGKGDGSYHAPEWFAPDQLGEYLLRRKNLSGAPDDAPAATLALMVADLFDVYGQAGDDSVIAEDGVEAILEEYNALMRGVAPDGE